MKRCWILLMSLACLPLAAQDGAVVRAALYLTGAAEAEELDEGLLERLDAFRSRPLRINEVPEGRLRASGLLSPYQTATLLDYRRTYGDILSWRELELVDGFGPEAVAALQPFLSLSSRNGISRDTVRLAHAGVVRASRTGYGAKYRLSAARVEMTTAFKSDRTGTGHLTLETPHGRLTAGDYNIRFGQGLALWTGFSLSGLPTVQAFVRRPDGISAPWSFTGTGTHRGMAWDVSRGRLQVTAFGSVPGLRTWMETGKKHLSLLGGGHVGWSGRSGETGVTAVLEEGRQTWAWDGRYNRRGADFCAEAAWRPGQGTGAVRGSTLLPLGDQTVLALQGRALPSRFTARKYGEYALAAGLLVRSGRYVPLAGRTGFGSSVRRMETSLTVDTALLPVPDRDPRRMQVRSVLVGQWQAGPYWSFQYRLTDRWRSDERRRTDLRLDAGWSDGRCSVRSRLNGVRCRETGLLGYLEAGWQGKGSCWLRLTGFRADQWDDRLYCYERDVPGSFSVPAYSGRGWAASVTGGFRWRLHKIRLRLNGRAGCVLRKDRPGKAVLNVQLMVD